MWNLVDIWVNYILEKIYLAPNFFFKSCQWYFIEVIPDIHFFYSVLAGITNRDSDVSKRSLEDDVSFFFLYLFVLVEMIYTVCSQGALNLLVLWMAKLDNLFLKFLVVDVKEPLGMWSFCWQLMKWGNDLPEQFKCKLRNFCIFQCRKCHFKT